jgi:hypothetical protein
LLIAREKKKKKKKRRECESADQRCGGRMRRAVARK